MRILRDRERSATELKGLSHPATGPHGGCLDHERVSGRFTSDHFDDIAGDQGGIGAVAAAVRWGLASLIPLIVLTGDAPLAALENVLELPEDVQILVLGDTEGMAEWTAAFPQQVAHCAEIGAVV
ncbi:MAG: hypothetical protein P8I99_12845 [Acidimicrobiales bacterium]|nr:hypothetical protein [Acidimicrobiales bacterium]